MPTILITGVSTGIGRPAPNGSPSDGWTVDRHGARPARAQQPIAGVELEALDLAEAGSAGRTGAARARALTAAPTRCSTTPACCSSVRSSATQREELERLYRVNVFGQLELVRPFLPAMRERGSGVIANVTSLGGLLVFPFFAAYNSTKWALEGISEGLWHELKPFGIRVKAIEPGFVETAIWGKVLPDVEKPIEVGGAYRPTCEAMRDFESSITDRTTPEAAAEEVFARSPTRATGCATRSRRTRRPISRRPAG